jgi:hypothetical protein
MAIFDTNALQAQDYAREQRLQEVQAFIAAALREFPSAALRMNTPAYVVKFNLMRKKTGYFLAFDGELNEYGEHSLDYNSSRAVIFTDGTYCFAHCGVLKTDWSSIVTSAEDFAKRLMYRFAEFRDEDSAKQIFDAALRGAYAELRGAGVFGLRKV